MLLTVTLLPDTAGETANETANGAEASAASEDSRAAVQPSKPATSTATARGHTPSDHVCHDSPARIWPAPRPPAERDNREQREHAEGKTEPDRAWIVAELYLMTAWLEPHSPERIVGAFDWGLPSIHVRGPLNMKLVAPINAARGCSVRTRKNAYIAMPGGRHLRDRDQGQSRCQGEDQRDAASAGRAMRSAGWRRRGCRRTHGDSREGCARARSPPPRR